MFLLSGIVIKCTQMSQIFKSKTKTGFKIDRLILSLRDEPQTEHEKQKRKLFLNFLYFKILEFHLVPPSGHMGENYEVLNLKFNKFKIKFNS